MAEARQDGKGGYLVTLPHGVIDRLGAMRAPGQSHSDVITRVARGMTDGAREASTNCLERLRRAQVVF